MCSNCVSTADFNEVVEFMFAQNPHTLVQRELILTTANFRNCPVKRQATLFTTSPVNLYDNRAAFVDPLDNSNEFLLAEKFSIYVY